MKPSILCHKGPVQLSSLGGGLALALAVMVCAPSAKANIYATNVKINGSRTPTVTAPGDPVIISYILNEPASGGVTVSILSGTTPVRTYTFNAGDPGALRGTNSVTWDGLDDNGVGLPVATYSVQITAKSLGYSGWTQISDDSNPGNYVWDGEGIAVDRVSTSPYYGRVFVSSADVGPNPGANPGDNVGVLKLNADGSFADEGGFTTGGYTWSGANNSPWRVEVSDDDYVYINDWTASGEIYRWDPTLSPGSVLHVLRQDNYPTNTTVSFSGPAIFGTGTNTSIWLANTAFASTLGLAKFAVTNDGTVASNDFGFNVVGIGGDLSSPYDVALDKLGNIYTVQFALDGADPMPRVLRFPAYDPSTNGGVPELSASWTNGQGVASQAGASGIAVDPKGVYLAVAFMGSLEPSSGRTNGNTQIMYATNGALVTSLDLGVTLNGQSLHQDTDCAWDAVGNVYYIDSVGAAGGNGGVWRAFSPPGPNQSRLVAVATVVLGGLSARPQIYSVSLSPSGDTVTIDFTAAVGDPASAYTLLSTDDPGTSFTPAAGATISGGNGVFEAIVPANGPVQFYRIQR